AAAGARTYGGKAVAIELLEEGRLVVQTIQMHTVQVDHHIAMVVALWRQVDVHRMSGQFDLVPFPGGVCHRVSPNGPCSSSRRIGDSGGELMIFRQKGQFGYQRSLGLRVWPVWSRPIGRGGSGMRPRSRYNASL